MRRPRGIITALSGCVAAACLAACGTPTLELRAGSDPTAHASTSPSPGSPSSQAPSSEEPSSEEPSSSGEPGDPSPTPSDVEPTPAATSPEPIVPPSAPAAALGIGSHANNAASAGLPVYYRVATHDRVLFLTIDDGYDRDPAVLALLTARHVPVTPFLTEAAIRTGIPFFRSVQSVTGQTVQDHTLSHPPMPRFPFSTQRRQICQPADVYAHTFGTRPWLFRPPYGLWNSQTALAAKDCGMSALVLWDVTLASHHISYAFGHSLRPGDIVLAHWVPGLAADLAMALDRFARQGYRIAALQDYLPRPHAST